MRVLPGQNVDLRPLLEVYKRKMRSGWPSLAVPVLEPLRLPNVSLDTEAHNVRWVLGHFLSWVSIWYRYYTHQRMESSDQDPVRYSFRSTDLESNRALKSNMNTDIK